MLGMLGEPCICVPPFLVPKEAHLDLLRAPAANHIVSVCIVNIPTHGSRSAGRDLYAIE